MRHRFDFMARLQELTSLLPCETVSVQRFIYYHK
jgi:hypothetical protein